MEKLNLDELKELQSTLSDYLTNEQGDDLSGGILTLITLPDPQFEALAPEAMDNFLKEVNTPQNKIALVQSLNAMGHTTDEIGQLGTELADAVDQLAISVAKREFIKQMIWGIVNAILDTEGVAKRIVHIPIELCHPDAKIPQYSTINDAGADVYAVEDATILPGETKIIPLGIKLAVPPGYAVLIHPRSGLSARTKMRVANSIGLCDSGYRDEYKVIIENIEPPFKDIEYEFDDNGEIHIKSIVHGSTVEITKGERIAQLRLVEVPKMAFEEVSEVKGIGEDRGGGLGHTGTN